MPWQERKTVEEQRVEFVRFAQADDANVAELCRRGGINRVGECLKERNRECDLYQPRRNLGHELPAAGARYALLVDLRSGNAEPGTI